METEQKNRTFLFIYLSSALCLTIIMYFLFQHANTDLAGKTCLQVAHQLQTQFKNQNAVYASTLQQLQDLDRELKDPRKPEKAISGIDERCADFFKLEIVQAGAETFEAQVILSQKPDEAQNKLKITEKGEVTKL